MAKRVTKGNLWGFIQSRPYASVADIRRLFMIDVEGAAPVATDEGACYIGLPQDAADLIRQLWQEGRIVLDFNPDVKARVVQGVYPARAMLGRQPAKPPPPVQVVTAPAGAPGDAATGSPKRRRRRRRRGGGGGGGDGGNGPDDAGQSDDTPLAGAVNAVGAMNAMRAIDTMGTAAGAARATVTGAYPTATMQP